MIAVRSRSGHVLHVADEAAADFWVGVGYQRVQGGAPAADSGKPAPRRRAKKSTTK